MKITTYFKNTTLWTIFVLTVQTPKTKLTYSFLNNIDEPMISSSSLDGTSTFLCEKQWNNIALTCATVYP